MHHSIRLASLASAAMLAACGTVNTPEDDDPIVQPDAGPPKELCTSAATALGDEDLDGAIDEGCAWKFSAPHWMKGSFGTPRAGGRVEPSAISSDGRTLFLIVSDKDGGLQRVWTLRRSKEGFDAPAAVTGPGLDGLTIGGITISADQRTAYVSARPYPGTSSIDDDDNDLYVATWNTAQNALGALELLTALSDSTLADDRPSLRADGRELVFTRGRAVFHAYADDAGKLGAPRLVTGTLDGDIGGPQISRDGRTLFYYYAARGGAYSLYRAERSDPSSDQFASSVQISDLGKVPDGMHPVVSESTRELFFASGNGRSWGPNTASLWRARICRDGEDCALPQVACPAGVRSEDGTHCYTGVDEPLAYMDARARCQKLGGDLVSLQSTDEQTFVWTKFGDRNRWIGAYDGRNGVAECSRKNLQPNDPLTCAFAWESGEAPTYDSWAVNEPSDLADLDEDCVILWYDDPEHNLHHGKWNDVSCTFAYPTVCEAVLFPTW